MTAAIGEKDYYQRTRRKVLSPHVALATDNQIRANRLASVHCATQIAKDCSRDVRVVGFLDVLLFVIASTTFKCDFIAVLLRRRWLNRPESHQYFAIRFSPVRGVSTGPIVFAGVKPLINVFVPRAISHSMSAGQRR